MGSGAPGPLDRVGDARPRRQSQHTGVAHLPDDVHREPLGSRGRHGGGRPARGLTPSGLRAGREVRRRRATRRHGGPVLRGGHDPRLARRPGPRDARAETTAATARTSSRPTAAIRGAVILAPRSDSGTVSSRGPGGRGRRCRPGRRTTSSPDASPDASADPSPEPSTGSSSQARCGTHGTTSAVPFTTSPTRDANSPAPDMTSPGPCTTSPARALAPRTAPSAAPAPSSRARSRGEGSGRSATKRHTGTVGTPPRADEGSVTRLWTGRVWLLSLWTTRRVAPLSTARCCAGGGRSR